MNYNLIATTVFTPIEYGAIGLAEEDAYKKFGEDNVDCYHTHFKPLEWNFMSEHTEDSCYIKLLIHKNDSNRVVGFHYLGPNAGEVTQVKFAVIVRDIQLPSTWAPQRMTFSIPLASTPPVLRLF